jgi:hypothetical protein
MMVSLRMVNTAGTRRNEIKNVFVFLKILYFVFVLSFKCGPRLNHV